MKRPVILMLLMLPLLAACAGRTIPEPGAPVTGKLTFASQPVAGVELFAYPAESLSLDEAPPYRSGPSDAEGRFLLTLPPGEYYLLARGKGYFAYYGRNPVTVSMEGEPQLNIALVEEAGAAQPLEPFVETGVGGRVLHGGAPLAGAMVFVYTDLTSRLKGMGYVMAGPTDEQGYFEAGLPAGTYYLIARQRSGRSQTGPLQAGDFIGYAPQNPIVVDAGEVIPVDIPVLEVPQKVERLEGSLFGKTSIRGRVFDEQGRPVSGVRVVLYDDPQMFNRPLYVSRPTGPDGRYVLSFPAGGTYYLAARDTLGGAPGPGDLYGTYDASPDQSLQVETGEALEGIDLVVGEMW